MTTSRTISVAVAITAVALVSSSATSDARVSAPPVRTESVPLSDDEKAVRPPTAARVAPHTYRWPVKPFDRQHPVRAFFGDPRIANHGRSRQFHFGVDISAPNGTPVYATITGRVWIHPLHATTVAVVGSDGVEHSYWHVVPVVRTGDRAIAYRTVLGHIEEPYGHVHFSERRDGRYLNPLRPGALGPFADHTKPQVLSLRAERGDLVVLVADETPLAVPRPWHDLPVMPSLVRWRLLDRSRRPVSGWSTVVDFRLTIPSSSEFDRTWAPGATQNHVRAPGRYRLFLARDLEASSLRGRVVEIALSDSRGNAARARFETTDLLSGG